ncbi:unnamed protein product (macronuclear) [Paramecium tetraurelia]|uniref:Uncharacterized protein n=1 Tax=Paramecium tetraurelia TaxID=5888 RepID=A0DKP1_PARTE|nr:uncharacterized protein GSPATT00017938001 [Paramecium tetraurelia]CAK83608.1 unnamed protein product [Paramecium tetraurelia]|eukprot:XP_001451005.1 hypothetical protein (macronuclear) [Paramecium tetraurelia strain d4-2]
MNKENNNTILTQNQMGRKTMKINTNDMDQFVNSRIVQLQKQLLDKELEIENLSKLNQDPKNQTSNKYRLLEIKQSTLISENQQMKTQLQQYESLNKTLQNKCDQLQAKIEYQNAVLEETQKHLEQERQSKYNMQFYQSSNHMDVQQEKILIKTQLDSLRKEKSQLISKVKELENSLQLRELNTNSNCSELSQLKQQLQQQIQKSSDYIEKTHTLEVKNTLLEAQSKSSQSHNDELRNLRSQVIQLQKDKNSHLEIQQDLESKLRLQTEHVLKLQNLLNDKTKQLVKCQERLSQVESIEEDNSILQQDLDKITNSMEEIQLENQRIVKFQQQKIDQLKRELSQTDFIREENNRKQEEIAQLKYQIERKTGEQEKEKESLEELQQLRESSKQWVSEKENYQKKIFLLTDELDKIAKQQCDQLRIQVETQIQMKFSTEKVQLENHIWQLSSQINDLQASLEQYATKFGSLNIENDQLREQLNEKQITQKTVIVLEGQLRNYCNELEKLKNMFNQRSQELELARNKILSLESCANYAQELERKVSTLMQDNQRLNSIIMDRCKNNW